MELSAVDATVVAAAIGVVGGLGGALLSGAFQARLQDARLSREDVGLRRLAISVVQDALQYAEAAYTIAQFDVLKWEPPMNRLLRVATDPRVFGALADETTANALAEAAFKFELGYKLLMQLDENPFKELPRNAPENDRLTFEISYVTKISGAGELAYIAVVQALNALGHPTEMQPMLSLDDRINEWRRRFGLHPVQRKTK